MPPREPRGLYLKREYFSDFEFQTELTAEERECFMGLWQLADDAGWLDYSPAQVAAHIYRFEGRNGAELLRKHTARLLETGRLKVLACGHAFLPRGDAHRRPGRPSAEAPVEAAHRKHGKRSVMKPKDPIPHLTVPHLTSPSPVGSPRARVKGAQNGVTPLADVVGDPAAPWNAKPLGSKKS